MQDTLQFPTVPLEPARVFVSHNQKEKPWVRQLVTQWRGLGIDVFFDEDSILGGEDVLAALERGIAGCRYVVLIVSRASMESQWVAREIAMSVARNADTRDRRLIPVLIEPVAPADLGLFLSSRSIIDLTQDEQREARYHHLLRSLGVDRADLPPPPELEAPVPTAVRRHDCAPSARDGNGVRTTTTTARAGIELVLNGDLDQFTGEKERRLIEAIKALLKTENDVIIRNKRRGSIILTLDLTPEEAERLYWAVKAGALDEFGVKSAALLEAEEMADDQTDAEPWRPAASARDREIGRSHVPQQTVHGLPTATEVHPTAIVDPTAELGTGVVVGPYSIIGPNVRVGARTRIGSHVLIERDTVVGEECAISQGAVLGTDPQDLKYMGEPTTLTVGDRTVIREYATLNRGTIASGYTSVGSDCMLMAYVHVAHDCHIGNHVILSNAVNMAGHVTIDDWAMVGGLTPIHQFVRIGTHAFVGGATRVIKDVPPYVKAAGSPIQLYGLNSIGLQRRGFSAEARRELKRAYRLFFASNHNVRQALAQAREELQLIPEVQVFLAFFENTERGARV